MCGVWWEVCLDLDRETDCNCPHTNMGIVYLFMFCTSCMYACVCVYVCVLRT